MDGCPVLLGRVSLPQRLLSLVRRLDPLVNYAFWRDGLSKATFT